MVTFTQISKELPASFTLYLIWVNQTVFCFFFDTYKDSSDKVPIKISVSVFFFLTISHNFLMLTFCQDDRGSSYKCK